MNRLLLALMFLLCAPIATAAEPPLGEVAFRQALLDLGTGLRLMCVAAHPDDEDGATLAMYRKKYGYHTIAVLATKGEGGQNEIGPELYDDLAVIRTHEMAGAAAVEGAELHFLNYPEFGYSKTLEETLDIWGHDWALERMVRVIRETRPDVIISNHGTRVDHGHHQAVGALLREAFDLAGDESAFPEHAAAAIAPWQPARLYLRSWRETGRDVTVDISELDPVRGKTYAEIAAQALSVHESQGMDFFINYYLTGRPTVRYHLEMESLGAIVDGGEVPAPGGVLFEGLMDRVPPEARTMSRMSAPRHSLRAMLLNNAHRGPKWNDAAVKALDLRLDVTLTDHTAVPGQAVTLTARVTDFAEEDATAVTGLTVSHDASAPWLPFVPLTAAVPLDDKRVAQVQVTTALRADAQPELPAAQFVFTDGFLAPQGEVVATVDVDGVPLQLRSPIRVTVAPRATISFSAPGYVIPIGSAAPLEVSADVTYFGKERLDDTLRIAFDPPLPGWQPIEVPIHIRREEGQRLASIKIALPNEATEAGTYTLTGTLIGANVTGTAPLRVIALNIPSAIRVGLIESYDTTLRTTLRQLAIPFDLLEDADISPDALAAYTIVLVDMRAYLERPAVAASNDGLLEYARRGGHLLVMYHKTFDWEPAYAPYPIQLSRNRTTREDAPVQVLAPDHPFFHTPNPVIESDWNGWLQERGLYFANEWDDRYTALVATADPGEDIPPGAWLTTPYGDGAYTYSALVWYRQLRNLNPGALKMFVNMLAL